MKNLIKFANDFKNIWEYFDKTIFSETEMETIINNLKSDKKSIELENYNTISNQFGVYIFYLKPHIKFTLDSLINEWTESDYSKYPKVVKTRFNTYKNINIENFYPLYIGKAEKLGSRIKEHIEHRDHNSTYSLKLNGRDNFTKENISFCYWKLPEELNEHPKAIKQFIITELEKKLRQQLKPWIGKQ